MSFVTFFCKEVVFSEVRFYMLQSIVFKQFNKIEKNQSVNYIKVDGRQDLAMGLNLPSPTLISWDLYSKGVNEDQP